jgi:hypothetical protein
VAVFLQVEEPFSRSALPFLQIAAWLLLLEKLFS